MAIAFRVLGPNVVGAIEGKRNVLAQAGGLGPVRL